VDVRRQHLVEDGTIDEVNDALAYSHKDASQAHIRTDGKSLLTAGAVLANYGMSPTVA
jgi:hypothetical protein